MDCYGSTEMFFLRSMPSQWLFASFPSSSRAKEKSFRLLAIVAHTAQVKAAGCLGDLSMPDKLATQNLMQKIQAAQPTDVLQYTTGMNFAEQSKYVSWRVDSALSFDTMELLFLTDLQFGNIACRISRIIEYRDWVLAEPNRFMLWGGDMIDAWGMLSKGSPWEQIGDAQSQAYQFVQTWSSARHRVLGYVGGNHEARTRATFGDVGLFLATLLRIPYSDGQQLIDIHFGQHQPFKIRMWHGGGSAQTKGGIAQRLDRFMQQGDSQLYLMGHLHQAMIIPAWKEVRDSGNQRVKLIKCIGAIGTSFLETWNTYGERAGYASHDVLMPRAVLYPEGKWEVTLR